MKGQQDRLPRTSTHAVFGKRSAQARIAIRAGGISDVKGGQFLNARPVPVQIVNDHGMTVPASVCMFAQVRMIWR